MMVQFLVGWEEIGVMNDPESSKLLEKLKYEFVGDFYLLFRVTDGRRDSSVVPILNLRGLGGGCFPA